MRTLNVSISDLEFSKFGLKKDSLSFSELLDLVSNELTKKALNESVELAGKYNLSGMTMEEITNYISKKDKMKVMMQASDDALFLADVQQVSDDFNFTDSEHI